MDLGAAALFVSLDHLPQPAQPGGGGTSGVVDPDRPRANGKPRGGACIAPHISCDRRSPFVGGVADRSRSDTGGAVRKLCPVFPERPAPCPSRPKGDPGSLRRPYRPIPPSAQAGLQPGGGHPYADGSGAARCGAALPVLGGGGPGGPALPRADSLEAA